MFAAYTNVEKNQDLYFYNLHRDIYDPFIIQNQNKVTPRDATVPLDLQTPTRENRRQLLALV
jgi:hypothetical protein